MEYDELLRVFLPPYETKMISSLLFFNNPKDPGDAATRAIFLAFKQTSIVSLILTISAIFAPTSIKFYHNIKDVARVRILQYFISHTWVVSSLTLLFSTYRRNPYSSQLLFASSSPRSIGLAQFLRCKQIDRENFLPMNSSRAIVLSHAK